MFMKDFLKPTKGKIILMIILFLIIPIIILYLFKEPSLNLQFLYTLPLPLFISYGTDISGLTFDFKILNLIIDIIFWYLISCIMMFFMNKIRKNNYPK